MRQTLRFLPTSSPEGAYVDLRSCLGLPRSLALKGSGASCEHLRLGFALEPKLQSPKPGFSGQWLNSVFVEQIHSQARDSQSLSGHLFCRKSYNHSMVLAPLHGQGHLPL